MLQDISPKKLDNHYSCDIKPDSDSIIFCFHGSEVVADENSDSIFPAFPWQYVSGFRAFGIEGFAYCEVCPQA